MLVESVALFLPEGVPDPTLGVRPGELWVEATLPPRYSCAIVLFVNR